MSRFRPAAASAAIAAALAGVAFGARAGTELERTAIVELALVLAGAAVVAAALLWARGERAQGGWAVLALAAFAALTGLSVAWSIAPDLSYAETGRTLAYLAVFAGAVAAAHLFPRDAAVVVRGVVLAAVAIAAYGLAARVWPGSFQESTLTGRIGLPLDYWNALAGVAALAIVPALWLGARRSGSALARALAFPAVGLLTATVLIAQSRGALAAAAAGVALWLAFVPLRLRSLTVLAAGAAGAVPVTVWALSKDPFSLGLQPPEARAAIAGDFGLLLAAMLVGLLVAGVGVEAVRRRRRLSVVARGRIGAAIAVGAAAAALAFVGGLAASERGLTGTVSDRIDELTAVDPPAPTGGDRFASASSSRAAYWRQAWSAFEERPVAGLGADSFALARLPYRTNELHAGHAHGFAAQTLADLGLLGLLAIAALLVAWLVAAARATGLGPRRRFPAPAWDSERAALAALAIAAVVYGVQSTVDWTWFVPGITVVALVAAGFVAGRGALGDRLPATAPADRGHPPRERIAAAAAVAVAALAVAWAIWQPAAADRAVAAAYDDLDRGDPQAALDHARSARERNPFSNEPLYAQAAAFAELGRNVDALRALRQAVLDHPRDPHAWLRVASFELRTLDSPRRALALVEVGLRLDPESQTLAALRAEALAALEDSQPSAG